MILNSQFFISNIEISVYGGVNETITFTSGSGAIVTTTTDENGYGGIVSLERGAHSVEGSVSKFSKIAVVNDGTTRINAWPDNANIVYWYGYGSHTPVGKAYAPKYGVIDSGWITSNRKALTITTNTNSITFTQPAVRGYYCGSAIFEDITTNGGTLTLLSSGKIANSNDPRVYFSYAANISSGTFTPTKGVSVNYGNTEIAISDVTAGTYDIAISAQNAALNYSGSVTLYAIYFAE